MTRSISIRLSVIALSLVTMSPAAYAGSATSSFSVTASVVASCTISTTTLAFGNYDPVVTNAAIPLDVNGSVTTACTKGAATTIGLDAGQNSASAVGTTRAMKLTTNYLSYELYQDPGRTTVWGNSGAALFTPAVAPSKAARVFNIYGRIPAAQDQTVGAYADTVVATVNF